VSSNSITLCAIGIEDAGRYLIRCKNDDGETGEKAFEIRVTKSKAEEHLESFYYCFIVCVTGSVQDTGCTLNSLGKRSNVSAKSVGGELATSRANVLL
jgi:hypothetical protein